ncbi:hypothetical protein [Streptomyces sp. RFCAC02]|uniref:hypothetical protein n=1 Tax=Streptomyces sp. RFCAC02 TaxID=2499143 RepID=UPI001F1013E2|nr:hypothetical protein [Streptomyces sp. RFCAC02]
MQLEPAPELWPLMRAHTGEVTEVRHLREAERSHFTGLVKGEAGQFFVKGMWNRPGGRRDSIIRERLINRYVQPVSPVLRWAVEDRDWILLGFELVDGRHADFDPGSPDLPLVADALNRISALACPPVAQEWRENRWNRFVGDDEARMFRGDALLHADIHPRNVLIRDDRAWVVDWSWPTRGAGFIDPSMLAVQLVSAGHTAEEADSWLTGNAAWDSADRRAVDAFARAMVRMWREMAERRGDESWLRAMVAAAEAWADHRGVATN